ncbi:hypothetical protein MTO96_014202 [Rhipicephalus appendiculatus]
MCFPNSPAPIKALAAFCFCVNTFNLIYLFMRYHELLPPDAVMIKQEIESVMPDVKNLDKYLAPREGTIFLGALAGISVVFDFLLYVGVEQKQPGLILSAWMWGVIDCSLDAAVGIASGNLTFMDSLSREPKTTTVTEPEDKSLILYRKMYGNTTTQQTTPTTIFATDDEGPRSNDTEYARARKATLRRKMYGNSIMMHKMPTTSATSPRDMYASSHTVPVLADISAFNTTVYRLTDEQVSVLVFYIILRLTLKLIALAGIKDYASQVVIQRQRRYLEMAQETTMKDSTEAMTHHSSHGSTASMTSEHLGAHPRHASEHLGAHPRRASHATRSMYHHRIQRMHMSMVTTRGLLASRRIYCHRIQRMNMSVVTMRGLLASHPMYHYRIQSMDSMVTMGGSPRFAPRVPPPYPEHGQRGHHEGSPRFAPHVPPPYLEHEQHGHHEGSPRFEPHVPPPYPEHEQHGHHEGSPRFAPHVPPPYPEHGHHEGSPRFEPHVPPPYPEHEQHGHHEGSPRFAPHLPPPHPSHEHEHGHHPGPAGFKD